MADQGRTRTRTRTDVRAPRNLTEKAEMRHHRLYQKSQRAQQLSASALLRGTPRSGARDHRGPSPAGAQDRVKDLGFDRPAATASPVLATPLRDAQVEKAAKIAFFRRRSLDSRETS